MNDWQERDDGEEEEFHDASSLMEPTADDILPSDIAEVIPEVMSGASQQHPDLSTYEDLILKELPMLFSIAGARLRTGCSDRPEHKKDVVQQGIVKFLQAIHNRQADYETPARILRMAVNQEGIRHSQICQREPTVDFDELTNRREESDTDNPIGYNPRELIQATSRNPTEIYIEILGLKEQLSKVSDQELFFLFFVERNTLAEIGKIRGWPVMKVQRRVKKLKRELGIDEEGPPIPAPDD